MFESPHRLQQKSWVHVRIQSPFKKIWYIECFCHELMISEAIKAKTLRKFWEQEILFQAN